MTFNQLLRQATLRRGSFTLRGFSGFFALLAAIVLLCVSPANAQLAGKGEIKGVITDSIGCSGSRRYCHGDVHHPRDQNHPYDLELRRLRPGPH